MTALYCRHARGVDWQQPGALKPAALPVSKAQARGSWTVLIQIWERTRSSPVMRCLFICPRSTVRRPRPRRVRWMCAQHCLRNAQRVTAIQAVAWSMTLAMRCPTQTPSPLKQAAALQAKHARRLLCTLDLGRSAHGACTCMAAPTAPSKGTQGATKKQYPAYPSAPDMPTFDFPCGCSLGQLGTPFWQTQELACRGLHSRRKYTRQAARPRPGVQASRSAFNPRTLRPVPGCPALPTSSGESPLCRPSNLCPIPLPRAASHRLAALCRRKQGLQRVNARAAQLAGSTPTVLLPITSFPANILSMHGRRPGVAAVQPASPKLMGQALQSSLYPVP